MSTPKIEIYAQASRTRNGSWRCDIYEGPGHHGLGSSPQEALLKAAEVWCSYEVNNAKADEAARAESHKQR